MSTAMATQDHATTEKKSTNDITELTLQQKYDSLRDKYERLLEQKVEVLAGTSQGSSAAATRRDSTTTHPGDDVTAKDAAKPATDANGTGAKIVYRMNTYDDKGMAVEEDYDPADADKNKIKSGSTTAATIIYHLDRHKREFESELKIENPGVKEVLQKHLAHYPNYHWTGSQLSIFKPFHPLVHHWKDLTKAIADNPNDTAHQDLDHILNAVKSHKAVKGYFETYNPDVEAETVDFNFLWTVFPPGELIVMPNGFMKTPQVFIARSVTLFAGRDRKIVAHLRCWTYDWDGIRNNFNRVGVVIVIDQFKGQRKITSLPAYPLKLFPQENLEVLKKDLVKRGKRFHDLCTRERGRQLFEYDGFAFFRGTGVRHIPQEVGMGGYDSDDSIGSPSLFRSRSSMRVTSLDPTTKTGRQMNMKGRVMVDFKSYYRHGPDEPIPMGDLWLMPSEENADECECDKCKEPGGPLENQRHKWDGQDKLTSKKYEDMDPDEVLQYMLCAPRVLGYHLMEKKWIEMMVDKVQDVDNRSSDEAFKKVQLTQSTKELIENLVRSHSNDKDPANRSPRSKMNDLTKGKGEGLVILLHGPPGVGKTLTAESVAQVTQKPLFPMGVGDVTTDPSKVERRLEQMFELAEAWHAVMLFDEADVFLESRASNNIDVTRVGLVSVLLRVLEYYQGILILTTNRIKSFDIAVQSRVNLAVEFEDLTPRQKTVIFKNLIDQLDDRSVQNKEHMIEWFEEDKNAKKWSKHLNGRQIRNVVFSAASLAGSSDKKKLKLEEIKTMMEATYDFYQYLESVTRAERQRNEVRNERGY